MSLKVIRIMAIDVPCKCGHLRARHDIRIISKNDFSICWECPTPGTITSECYHKFKLDNLKYLEQKYEALHG
jgi:hypothetical protein